MILDNFLVITRKFQHTSYYRQIIKFYKKRYKYFPNQTTEFLIFHSSRALQCYSLKIKSIKNQLLFQYYSFIIFYQSVKQMQTKNNPQQTKRYPINAFPHNRLITLGQRNRKLLCKIKTVKLNPEKQSIEKSRESIQNSKNNKIIPEKYKYIKHFPHLLKFWHKRYHLFSKFDQGIMLDEQSWYSVTPERLSQYLAQKAKGVNTILDGFCGPGGDSIQFALAGKHVICNDICPQKIKCLMNNAKIYQANDKIILSQQDFLQFEFSKVNGNLLQNRKVELIYLAPPWGGIQYYQVNKLSAQDFQPDLQKVIKKAFQIDHQSIMMLLPANIDIENIVSIISNQRQQRQQQHKNAQINCAISSLMLQKVFYRRKLKFVILYYGKIVNQHIRIEQQNQFFQAMLLNQGTINEAPLQPIYEKYGRANFFNKLFQFQKLYPNLFSRPDQHQKKLKAFILFIRTKKQQKIDKSLNKNSNRPLESIQQLQKFQKIRKQVKIQGTQKGYQKSGIDRSSKEKISKQVKKKQENNISCQQFINL